MDEDAEFEDELPDAVAAVECPHCGAASEIALDPGGGATQSYVEDCPVCCQPWQVLVRYLGGTVEVTLSPE
jgi:hypothetical protein